MRPPETRYARSQGSRIAYQVVGQASFDLVVLPGLFSNLEIQWEDPRFSQLARRLSAFSRLIVIDKAGTGLSDRQASSASDAVQAVHAVIDAAGSGRVAVLGAFDGAATALSFAARYPARTRALVLFAPAGSAGNQLAALGRIAENSWGRGETAPILAPEEANDPRFRTWWARFERLSASPGEASALLAAAANRGAGPQDIALPTLVLRRAGDAFAAVADSRAVAATIPGAGFIELAGRDHLLWGGDVDTLADRVEAFLTGALPTPSHARLLAALLVARIVNPERLMIRFGEDRWQDRLERFATAAAEIVIQHGGYPAPGDPTTMRGRFDGPIAAIRAATELKDAARALELPLAAGLSVGEVDKHQFVPAGLAFFVTEEIAKQASSGEILASRVVADLCGSLGQAFFDHEPLKVAGIAGPLHVVSIGSPNPLEPREKPERDPDLGRLSVREREVLRLVAEGLSNSAIAGELRLSEHTVKRHVANILMKLDLPTRAAAAVLADKLPARQD